MPRPTETRIWAVLSSLKLTIVCLVLLMVLVVACTLAQAGLGTFAAVNLYIRSLLIWWEVPGTGVSIPIFPGGGLVGLLLMVNLVTAQIKRLELSWRKVGLWVVHAGLILLFVGEFVTGFFQKEMQLAIEEGQTIDYVESPREVELAITGSGENGLDDVWGIPEAKLARTGSIPIPGTPIVMNVKSFYGNADLKMDGGTPSATMGVGASVAVRELPPPRTDDEQARPAAVVEPTIGGKSYGTWLVAIGLGAPQSFIHEGKTYALALRQRREYLPFKMTLRDFRHDVYAGTDIPKNFSSLVHLKSAHEERDVLIYMNQPLRYDGKAFYQASFGKGDTLSVLQVVENPGWLLPYNSCVLVGAGLIIHFMLMLLKSLRRQAGAAT